MDKTARRPPEDSSLAPHRLVSKEAFNRLWASYDLLERWGDPSLIEFGLDNLWNFDESCWWVIHPQGK
jgi:hypothetical protein